MRCFGFGQRRSLDVVVSSSVFLFVVFGETDQPQLTALDAAAASQGHLVGRSGACPILGQTGGHHGT